VYCDVHSFILNVFHEFSHSNTACHATCQIVSNLSICKSNQSSNAFLNSNRCINSCANVGAAYCSVQFIANAIHALNNQYSALSNGLLSKSRHVSSLNFSSTSFGYT
jgi:hypothetical protein